MPDRSPRVTRRVCITAVLALAVTSCGFVNSESEEAGDQSGNDGADAVTLPAKFLGRWYYTGSSGGITGNGTNAEISGYIVIGEDNSFETYTEDGTLLRRSEFTVTYEPAIFGPEPEWMLNQESVLSGGGNGGLRIFENWPDGFTRHFARSR